MKIKANFLIFVSISCSHFSPIFYLEKEGEGKIKRKKRRKEKKEEKRKLLVIPAHLAE
jgi:hypothetical protein